MAKRNPPRSSQNHMYNWACVGQKLLCVRNSFQVFPSNILPLRIVLRCLRTLYWLYVSVWVCACVWIFSISFWYHSKTPSRAPSRHSPTYQWYVCRLSHSVLRSEANLYIGQLYIFFPFNSVWKSSKLHGFFHFVSQFFTYILTVCLNWVSMFPMLVCFNQWPLLWYERFSKNEVRACVKIDYSIFGRNPSIFFFFSSLPFPFSPYQLWPKKVLRKLKISKWMTNKTEKKNLFFKNWLIILYKYSSYSLFLRKKGIFFIQYQIERNENKIIKKTKT